MFCTGERLAIEALDIETIIAIQADKQVAEKYSHKFQNPDPSRDCVIRPHMEILIKSMEISVADLEKKYAPKSKTNKKC